jgi:hypothetical protein
MEFRVLASPAAEDILKDEYHHHHINECYCCNSSNVFVFLIQAMHMQQEENYCHSRSKSGKVGKPFL